MANTDMQIADMQIAEMWANHVLQESSGINRERLGDRTMTFHTSPEGQEIFQQAMGQYYQSRPSAIDLIRDTQDLYNRAMLEILYRNEATSTPREVQDDDQIIF